ncbi:DNA repair protein RecN [Ichthyobacterium seriolicida]|uniref:DNA repair protein RecN n=1 Tax=Ichthyobacterium seriolicida TaxID=242600 RepID=A0A1J1E5A2_9FLAO|nr:DNA repair protein RecN [Ichthyobacterium seriolicida]BAV95236.1 DNA repair protein RecN [Ichthyobacterium seriolicida]
MLKHISVKNYALIENLEIDIPSGFTTITGETGAGKSILLGAIGLALGNRADLKSLKNADQKCVIEVQFYIKDYKLKEFFESHDLDYEDNTILRREILPSGKSRSFINDVPSSLSVINKLGEKLLDIHSQHQTLKLKDSDFQMKLLDSVAGNTEILIDYKNKLREFKREKKEFESLKLKRDSLLNEFNYNSFLLQELQSVKLIENEQEDKELELEKLTHVEDIKNSLQYSIKAIDDDEIGISNVLNNVRNSISNISKISDEYNIIYERINSIYLELDDVYTEMCSLVEDVEYEPHRLEEVNSRLKVIYDLEKKHSVGSVQELLDIKSELEKKVNTTENLDQLIREKELFIDSLEGDIRNIASAISKNRERVIPKIESDILKVIERLGMPSSFISLRLSHLNEFRENGVNDIEYLFSHGGESDLHPLNKIASGGELSRIMIAIKSIMSRYDSMPTIIFDEIDTGISGNIADKMGDVMIDLGRNIQVISITHLPQIAAKGQYQLKVYKENIGGKIETRIRLLSSTERVTEIAEIISGNKISEAAIQQARQLLGVD